MDDREIQQACLDAYTDALEDLPSDFDDALNYLDDMNLDSGLCRYSQLSLDEFIYDKKWVHNLFEVFDEFGSEYWAKTPYMSEDIEQIRESLQFRINKLQELLNG